MVSLYGEDHDGSSNESLYLIEAASVNNVEIVLRLRLCQPYHACTDQCHTTTIDLHIAIVLSYRHGYATSQVLTPRLEGTG